MTPVPSKTPNTCIETFHKSCHVTASYKYGKKSMMTIAKDLAVALDYKLTLDNGIIVDASTKDDPLWFICGRGQLLPKFEKEIMGLKVGDTTKFSLTPEEGYGKSYPDRIVDIKKDTLPDDNYMPGAAINLNLPDGDQIEVRVVSIDKDTVKIDLNNELAGQNLNFTVSVLEVRLASKEELVHGHVHSPGHDHDEEHVHGPGCHH